MSYLARGPSLLGIDSQANADSGRPDTGEFTTSPSEAAA
jgi:hypothetical protein